jgi:hypothetical protein
VSRRGFRMRSLVKTGHDVVTSTDLPRLDIMAATGEQMEAGYKKLHRWCTFGFRQFTKDAHLEVSATMREAVKRLRERPVLFK